MKIDVVPKGLIERVMLRSGNAPTPLLHTFSAVMMGRLIMTATKLGVFEALEARPLDADELASTCGMDARATAVFAKALVCIGYLSMDGSRYDLSPLARRWMLESSPGSLRESTLFALDEWDMIASIEDFVCSGKALEIHKGGFTDEQWGTYQRGMRSRQAGYAEEAARRTPVPKGACRMLDIGGSHGLFSVAICRRHAGLESTILDLPEAIEHAAPILAKDLAASGMEGRVVHKAGNALADDLGTAEYDVVFMSHLAHHFDNETNLALAQKVANSLRPGGYYVIQESIRTDQPDEHNQLGGMLDLYFAMISESGTWSFEEMAAWQRAAGLTPQTPVSLCSAPGMGQQSGMKS